MPTIARVKHCLGEIESGANSKKWIESMEGDSWGKMKAAILADSRKAIKSGKPVTSVTDRLLGLNKTDRKTITDALAAKPVEKPVAKEVKKEAPAKVEPAKPKEKSVIGPVPKDASPAAVKAHTELNKLVSDFLPSLSRIFTGVETVDKLPDTLNEKTGKMEENKSGGFYYDPRTGKLGIALNDIARELGRVRNKKKWVIAAIVEEAIHAVAIKLEKDGKINPAALMDRLKEESPEDYENFRKAYLSKSRRQAIDEFIRMTAQGKIKFKVGKVYVNGELTEMQFSKGAIAAIKDILKEILSFIRDIRKSVSGDLAAEFDGTIKTLEDAIRGLVEEAQNDLTSRPPGEEFSWSADDDMMGTQSSDNISASYEKRPGKKADGEGGFFDVYNVVGGPADGTTFMVPEGAKPKEVQAAADEKTKQFSRMKSQPSDRISKKQDEDYMKAVESGDMVTAQKMVDEAAKAAGYNVGPVLHGTKSRFNEFSKSKVKDRHTLSFGFHFTTRENEAVTYATDLERGHTYSRKGGEKPFMGDENIIRAYVKISNPLVIDTDYNAASMEADNKKSFITGTLEQAEMDGRPYDGVIINRQRGDEWDHKNVIVFDPNQIKSADPVTRDNAGNVIPLSERFNDQSNDIRFSQPSDDIARAQEMGVPELGDERAVERWDAIREGAQSVFNSSEKSVDSFEDYQEAHDLIRALTSGNASDLEKLWDKAKKNPALDDQKNMPASFAAILYGELADYAVRQSIENTADGRTADLSLLRTLMNGYGNLPAATLKVLSSDEDPSATMVTKMARAMASLRNVSKKFGMFLKWHQENVAQGTEAMKKQGFTDAEIKAINDFLNKPVKSTERAKAIDNTLKEKEGGHKNTDNSLTKAVRNQKPKNEKVEGDLPVDADALLEAEAKKISAKFATEDTPSDKEKNEDPNLTLRKLAQLHLKEWVPDFIKIATNMGLSEDSAAELDRMIRSTRDARNAVKSYKETIEDDVDETMDQKALAQLRKFATPDTWGPDKTPKQQSDLEALVKQHVKAPVVNFTEQAEALGISPDLAAELDKAISATRTTREEVKKFREENPSNKAMDQTVDRLLAKTGPKSGKVATVRDIVEAMNEFPEHVNNPAWRKAVVERWLNGLGVDIGKVAREKLDVLIATVFADAQAKMLKDYLPKEKKLGPDGKPIPKAQPSELEKLTKALRVGMITGAPAAWQAAFTEKTGMRPLTVEETQEVLKNSAIVADKSGTWLKQDQVDAAAKIATIIRRAAGDQPLAHLIASSYTISSLTGLSTQAMQVTAGAINFGARLFEDAVSGVFTMKGIAPVLNAIQAFFDTYKRTWVSAIKNDSYREQHLETIAQMSALKTLLENKTKEFKDANLFKRIKLIVPLMTAYQDYFRRFMSSSDDAAVAGLKSYISTIEGQKLLRSAGVSQSTINKMFDVAKEHANTLTTQEQWKQLRPESTWSSYKAWVVDAVAAELQKTMEFALAEKYIASGKTAKESAEDAKERFNKISEFALDEAEIDVAVGPKRDTISDVKDGKGLPILLDPLQFAGETAIGYIEKALKLDPKKKGAAEAARYLAFRSLFGYVRIPWNSLSRSVYRGPLGLYRLLVSGAAMPGKFSERGAKMYQRTMGTAMQQAQRRREALIWSLTMGALFALAKGLSGKDDDPEDDIIKINGKGPDDPQAREAWRAAGHQPSSIEFNIGGARISIPFGRAGLEAFKPGLMLLSTIDDMSMDKKPEGFSDAMLKYAQAYGGNTLYNANLFGFRNIANMRTDTMGDYGWTKKVAYMFSPLIPFSGFQKSVGKMISPDRPDDKTLKGAIAMSTPLWFIGEKGMNLYSDPIYATPSSTVGDVTNRLLYGVGLPFSVELGTPDKDKLDVYKFSLRTGRSPSASSRKDVDTRLMREKITTAPMSDSEWHAHEKAAGESRMNSMKEMVKRVDKDTPDSVIERNLRVVNRRAENAGKKALRK